MVCLVVCQSAGAHNPRMVSEPIIGDWTVTCTANETILGVVPHLNNENTKLTTFLCLSDGKMLLVAYKSLHFNKDI